MWDDLLIGLLILAFIAVLAASKQSAGAVQSIGSAIAQLAQNVVGTKQNFLGPF